MSHINELCTDVETWDEARFLAELDYELNFSSELTVGSLTVYRGDDSCDLEGPFRVKLERTPASDLMNTCGEYLDPYWDVRPLETLEGTSPWTHGPSYRVLEAVRENRRVVA